LSSSATLNKVSFHLHGTLMLAAQHQCPTMINRYLVVVLLACTLAHSQTPAPDHWIAVRAGRLFDPKSDKLATNQVVTIKGDRIVEVGPADRVKIPAGADIIDLSHATVLPGLIDAHTHVFGNGPDLEAQILRDSYQYRTLTALANANKDLMVGFTTLRDLKTLGAMYSDVDLRNAIDRGIVQGPRMQVSTRGIQSTGGFLMNGYSAEVPVPMALQVVDSPWAARAAVREQIAHGTDWVKLYATYQFHFTDDGKMVIPPTFAAEEVTAIVDEAHKKGHKVSCHAFGGEGLHNCLNAGVDSLEHGVLLEDSDLKMMVEKGIYLLPTLYHYQLDREHDIKRFGGHSVAEVSERSFPKAVAAGVKIAFGSGVGPFAHGSQTKEFAYMVKFGMAPVQAIRAATVEAATLMGWEDRIGSLEAGKFADMIAVTGDPTSDITELERVKFVMKGGQVFKNELK
jgi:imidazolonepropionase-like amidohydrolase